MVVCVLDRAPQRQELNVFELNVACRVVLAFAWSEFRNDTVHDISIVVDDENVSDAHVLIVQQGLAQAADYFIKVLTALQALEAERDAGHDCLLLLDDHARVGANRSQVEVVLNA